MTGKKPLVINLIGGPGCGKSTAASGLFYALKKLQVNVEWSTEWVKNKVYEESFRCMEDKVDVIVTDCCLLNSLVYGERDEDLDRYILKKFKSYNNLNVLLCRKQEYVNDGRVESKDEALKLDNMYRQVLRDNNIDFIELDNVDACDYIISHLLKNNMI